MTVAPSPVAPEEQESSCAQKCCAVLSASCKYIAIIILIIVYSCLGGRIFQILEEGSEEENCWDGKQKEQKARVRALKAIWTSWMEEEENMTALVYRMDDCLKEYRDAVMDIGGDYTNDECATAAWTWANAVLFSVTIISTIGYGHIAPVTWEGQIVCICYAVVGLPIFGVFLSLLGDLLADSFLNAYRKFTNKYLFCCGAADVEEDDDRTLPPSSAGFTTPDIRSPDLKSQFSPQEAKSNESEVLSQKVGRYNDSAASTITFHQIWPLAEGGSDVPKLGHLYDNPKHVARMDTFDSFRSGSSFYERTDLNHEDKPGLEAAKDEEGTDGEKDELEDSEQQQVQHWHPQPVILHGQDKHPEKEEETTVPLTVSLSLMVGYLGLGALLFGYFEGWSPIEGAYFSFITLSTIGFGDFVPGSSGVGAMGAELKMLCAAIYIMFGMALLAMCFNLMQEKVLRKLTWIAKRCKRTKTE